MISIIVVVAANNAIGKNNALLCHVPGDLKRFKKITTGHTVIMGKKTWESLPDQPLSNRRNIVISDDPSDRFEGAIMAFSLETALSYCLPREETFIIGGASIYSQFLPLCDRLYLTKIHQDFEGDVFFPPLNFSEWTTVSQEDFPPGEHHQFSYSFLILDRIIKKGEKADRYKA